MPLQIRDLLLGVRDLLLGVRDLLLAFDYFPVEFFVLSQQSVIFTLQFFPARLPGMPMAIRCCLLLPCAASRSGTHPPYVKRFGAICPAKSIEVPELLRLILPKTTMASRDPVAAGAGSMRASPELVDAVRLSLANIFESRAFNGSDRARQFLQFVVECTLEGTSDNLKERVIGIEVFGRPADYEAAGDAIVRVQATEVRKRLAQYYGEHEDSDDVRIELPTGSYIPRFQYRGRLPVAPWDAVEPEQKNALAPRRNHWRWVIPVLACGILAAIAVVPLAPRAFRSTELDQFWEPVHRSSETPIISIGGSETAVISDRLRGELRSPAQNLKPPAMLPIRSTDIVQLSNFHISMGNFYAVVNLSELFGHMGIKFHIRPGADLKFDELRGHPVILVGAFSNPWTLRKNAELRFGLLGNPVEREGCFSIRDRMHPDKSWNLCEVSPGNRRLSYAIVSRVFDPSSGSVFVSVAGINALGTQAAGEFLTNPRYWKDLARILPADWQRKNLQSVLETAVVGTPRVVGFHAW